MINYTMGQLVIVGAVVEPDLAELLLWSCFTAVVGVIGIYSGLCRSMVKAAPLAVPEVGSCACSGRAWRLCAARHSQEEAGPRGAQPLPRLLEPIASKAARFPTF